MTGPSGIDRPTYPAPQATIDFQVALSRPSPQGVLLPGFSSDGGMPQPLQLDSGDSEKPLESSARDALVEPRYPVKPPAPLKQKPDPTTVPLGVYSLGSDDVATDRAEPPQDRSKPPRR
jgi:hypothetical protein